MLGIIGGRRAELETPFILGTIRCEIGAPFDIERTAMAKSLMVPFWVIGDFSYAISAPFVVEGDFQIAIEAPFIVLDASTGAYDEGGLTSPLIGWFDNWEG